MDIGQLEAFLAIARLGTFSKAARKLHRSQPAISRRLGLLEAELGAKLFERIQRRVELTDAGRAFQPHAEAMLASMRSGTAAVQSQLGHGAGTASVAIVGTLLDRNLAELLAKFVATQSPSQLSITTSSSESISAMVRAGDVTMGVRYFLDRSPDVYCAQIGWEPMVVVASRSAKRNKGSRSMDPSTRWVGFSPSRVHAEGFGPLLQTRLQQADINASEIMFVDSLSAQKRLIEAGVGLGFLPASSIQQELTAGVLVIVHAPKISTRIPIALVHRRTGYLSPLAKDVMRALGEHWGGNGRQ